MEDDIPTSKGAMCVKVIEFVSLLSSRVTNEETTISPRRKLIGGKNRGGIG